MSMYLVVSAFTSSRISLLAATQASAFVSMVLMLPRNIITSST